MTYQVSRNGQLYGPYTLEDLQRYVASGNILPTDMAKSEDMMEGDASDQAPDTPQGETETGPQIIARYVKPHFQGSLANLQASAAWSAVKKGELMALRTQAIEKAKQEYFTRSGSV